MTRRKLPPLLASITRPAELRRLCAHLGYPTHAPPIAQARAPPQPDPSPDI